jgi:hypothetical protein
LAFVFGVSVYGYPCAASGEICWRFLHDMYHSFRTKDLVLETTKSTRAADTTITKASADPKTDTIGLPGELFERKAPRSI